MKKQPVVLIIRDGWGENHNPEHDAFNAIKLAKHPNSQYLAKKWPRAEVTACGLDVGLPQGVMGNSEVGHQNIGAGRIVDQEIVRINKAFESGSLLQNPTLLKTVHHLWETDATLHLIGLVSDAGVHAMIQHLLGLLRFFAQHRIHKVFIHAITDGRDTSPTSGLKFIEQIEKECQKLSVGKIASVMGRYWAMDRDNRWDRVQKAYDCLVGKHADFQAESAREVIKHYYEHPLDETRKGDEFITPSWMIDEKGRPIGRIQNNDAVIFFNFRGDRPRELTHAFLDESFSGFNRPERLDLLFVTMTEYEAGLCPDVIFHKPPKMKNILGEIVSKHHLTQFRCAETEKYPHVTFFFNDYREEPFRDEDRELIPSPKDVPTYDLKPEMSVYAVCEATKKAILSGKYDLIVVNFANADMVGHTGSLPATVKAVEAVDHCVGELLYAIDAVEGSALITADHGNADQMWDPVTHTPHTQHTLNPVEVTLYGKSYENAQLKPTGRLADLAPTLLEMLNIEKPVEMTGESLIISE